MVSHGQVRYARNGDVHIAYRVLGDGDLSIVFVPGYVGRHGSLSGHSPVDLLLNERQLGIED